ncbi:MAG: tRNA (guanosine(37)-N1)-methyltransferase TrmD [Clostridia bacterium]|nr:tRNA (guanosine(37)-N1)-methyltransferase TrmD [Clostridia bacterium]
MRFDVMTLFPELVSGILGTSITGRAIESGCFELYTHNIREFSDNLHRHVDDTPYGGGAGMVMQAQPVYDCYKSVERKENSRVVYMSPKGKVLTQKKAKELAGLDQLIILCGHYEGIDQRVLDEIVDEDISIGDYVLTGGELPACVLIDCISRMLDGVLAEESCYTDESIYHGLLEYPHYTRPAVWHGAEVPEVLKQGNHKEIEAWRHREALRITKEKRPDLV